MRRTIVTVLLAAGVASLAACMPHNSLGTGSTACIKAIPVAAAEVRHKGKPEGVRTVRAASLANRIPEVAPLGRQDVCLVAYGSLFPTCVKAAERLRQEGLSVGVINARFAKPIDRTTLLKAVEEVPLVLTVEEGTLDRYGRPQEVT